MSVFLLHKGTVVKKGRSKLDFTGVQSAVDNFHSIIGIFIICQSCLQCAGTVSLVSQKRNRQNYIASVTEKFILFSDF